MNVTIILGIVFCALFVLAFIICLLARLVWEDYVAEPGLILFPCLLAVALPFTIVGGVVSAEHYDKILYEIVSIKNGVETSGRFFLGCGSVEEKQYYYYYYKSSVGYKLGKQDIDYTCIIEDDMVTPCVHEIKEKGTFKAHYNIYVPEGTIVTTFTLN